MQTLHAVCSKAKPNIFAPSQDGQNLITWRRSLPLPANPVWWGLMHTILRYRGNRPTHTNTPTHPQTGPITLLHCTAASTQCKNVLGEMQTLRADCSKVEPKFSPRRRPHSRGMGWPKFDQLEMVTTFTYKTSLVRIDASNFKIPW